MDAERLKQLEQAEEELRRRRERGKLAQRAFRKRQNNTTRDKHDETRRLKEAISKIVRVARHDDRPELVEAIREAAEMTGLDKQAIAKLYDDEEGNQTKRTAKTSQPSPDSRHLLPAERVPSTELSTNAQEIPLSIGTRAGWILKTQDPVPLGRGSDVRRTSTRLDYGMWFDTSRFIRAEQPPSDIIPYLGKGKNTFAGRLFWTCGELLLEQCRRVEMYEHTNPKLAGEAKRVIWNMVQHSKPLHNIRYIIALAEARREFRDRGYIEGNNPAGEIDSAFILQEQVMNDYKAKGKDVAVWLSPMAVELELRKCLSPESSRQLDRVLQLGDSNQVESPLLDMIQSLIWKLAATYICFGDGPRWRTDHVLAILSGSTTMLEENPLLRLANAM
ncbi:uncharacterized protein F4812DRAFT_245454 [Daldinia caldariorum]|uniref:uncharacterized protein n=1 Tax=Daldinia caldariorum TaxID=326644 RepID=UPI002008403B|nr:uncharacterized protein F4812DRAFT_245454 [Daldinia caldariorum]KAI1463382.1 hypothetical protein F4812DRAFT_245454 [Daldinia caldariorum]